MLCCGLPIVPASGNPRHRPTAPSTEYMEGTDGSALALRLRDVVTRVSPCKQAISGWTVELVSQEPGQLPQSLRTLTLFLSPCLGNR